MTTPPPPTGPGRRLPTVARLLAATWSVSYLVLGPAWALGAPGYPFDGGGPGPGASVLDPLPRPVGGWLLAGLAATTTVLVALTCRRRPARTVGVLLAAVGVVLAVVLTDVRVLMVLGYLPLMVFTAVLGRTDPGTVATMFVWSNLNQVVLMVAGVCLVTVGARVLTDPAQSGDVGTDPDGRRAATALRVGRWSTVVAVVIPVGYAATRIGWFLGLPVGISREFLRRMVEADAVAIGAGLGAMGLVGAVLTIGLVRPWGEVWPGWIPLLRHRTIPARLPAWLALAVSVPITSAGWMYVRKKVTGQQVGPDGAGAELGAWLPEMFWPVWGVALATAALAYLTRRRTGLLLRTGPDGLRTVPVR